MLQTQQKRNRDRRRGGKRQNQDTRTQNEIIQKANSIYHRLLSIQQDVISFLVPVVLLHWFPDHHHNFSSPKFGTGDQNLLSTTDPKPVVNTSHWPVISNERCGSVGNKN